MKTPRSTKQKDIYEFIKQYINDKGYSPSIREICKGVGLSSTSTVHGHLKRLVKKGLIKKDATKPRTIEITEDKKELINIPILGKITNNLSILSSENIEGTFPLPINFIKKTSNELFIIKIKSNDMIDVGLLGGDFSIVEKTDCVKNGNIVVAMLENEVIIRRFFKKGKHIQLEPENTAMEPILVDNCNIIGKVIGTYRSY
jgi:repressor LexA